MDFNGTLIEFAAKKKQDGSTLDSTRLKFVILDAPAPSTLPMYIKELQRHKIKHLVRVCTQTYRADVVNMAQIQTYAWPFEDGAPPPTEVVNNWLSLVDTEVENRGVDGKCGHIAVHCVAGLGRAPILVAIALVEYGDFLPLDAAGFIRERRKGAINEVQLKWLMTYKPRWKRGASLPSVIKCCPIQ